jgi:hypothetical protein
MKSRGVSILEDFLLSFDSLITSRGFLISNKDVNVIINFSSKLTGIQLCCYNFSSMDAGSTAADKWNFRSFKDDPLLLADEFLYLSILFSG